MTAQSTTLFPAVPIPRRLIVPLDTREGESVPPKEAGTRVKRGEPLADPASTPQTTHVPLSPVDGRIVATTRVDLLNGHRAAAVEIDVEGAGERGGERGGEGAGEDAPPPPPAPATQDGGELALLIDRLRRAGVWAQRRNGPDLIGQLYQAIRRPCDAVVCNVLDGEDAVELNGALARAFTDELLAGVRAIGRAVGASRRRIAIDADASRRDIDRLSRAAAGEPEVVIIPLANSYPQPDPTLLLYTLFKRRLRPGRLPAEQGVLLLDAAAAIAVGRVVTMGRPMLDVPLAVRDVRRDTTRLVTAAVGTPLRHVLEHLGIDADDEPDAIPRVGDALRDVATHCDAVVAGGELVVHAGYASPARHPDPCIRCGWCVAACPTLIHPAGLLEASQRDDAAAAERYGIESCIECGVCSYVCPSRLPLLGAIRRMRMRGRA